MNRFSRTFSFRGFVSLLLAFCFAGLAVSGIILYFAPPCSIAEQTGWRIVALSKDQWASLHQVMALVILILAVFHLFVFNLKTFCCYLKRRKSIKARSKNDTSGPVVKWYQKIPKEVVAAVFFAIILYIGAISMKAPFGWLHDGADIIKEKYRSEMPAGSGEGMYQRGQDSQGRGEGSGRNR